ncbi:MAG: alpha/beta fold hydrolase [Rhodobacteraceae bacterium]|nr:alpha/beta fold hydrolase [Paracoccaceae bacterium]
MANPWHVKWLQEGVKAWNYRRNRVSFFPDLRGVNFFELLPEDYRTRPKASRFFEGLNLKNSDLVGADLSNLNFRRANFTDANLTNSKLDASNFNQANFKDAKLTNASARRAELDGAKFIGSALQGLNLEGASIKGTIVLEASLDEEQYQALGGTEARRYIEERRDKYLAARLSKSGNAVDGAYLGKSEAPHKERDVRYDIYYGTNRVPIYEQGELIDYGCTENGEISYGICEVVLPAGRPIGKLGPSLWKKVVRRVMGEGHTSTKVLRIVELNESLFLSHLLSISQAARGDIHPTLFIHGYNNSFQSAAQRAAQIGYDLGLGQGIGLFSWPSSGSKSGYTSDEAMVDVSKYKMADFIEVFLHASGNRQINIIAHSMGCRCLMGALEVLGRGRTSVLKRINQIILAAADIDTRHMNHLALYAVRYCNRTTAYTTSKDDALKVSGWLHGFQRVGASPPTYVFSGMDTIVANNSGLGSFGHQYVATSRVILGDIFQLLKHNASPNDRHAVELVLGASPTHWRLRD